MTPEVWVAVVSTVGLVLIAIITNRTRQHAKIARTQLENNHFDADGNPINLREEQDERFISSTSTLALLVQIVTGIQSDIRGMRRDIGRTADTTAHNGRRITSQDEILKGLLNELSMERKRKSSGES